MSKPSPYQAPAEEHAFAAYVRLLGKGKKGTRDLDPQEAEAAFGMILRGETEPLQLGAFLMLLRVKEETGEELAGFVRACRREMVQPPAALRADLDWSCYAGKRHQHPWFILAVLLLSQAGYRVFIHGSDGHTPGRLYTEQAMAELGFNAAGDWSAVAAQLDEQGLSYLPLRQYCQPLHEMMQLRPLLGLRSPVNTLARLINPLRADASLQSVFHPAYGQLHQQADQLLQQSRSMVFKGESGEIEIKPQADTRLKLLSHGECSELTLARSMTTRAEPVDAPATLPLRQLWAGRSEDDYGLQAVLATTAAALLLLEPALGPAAAQQQARQLWQERDLTRLH